MLLFLLLSPDPNPNSSKRFCEIKLLLTFVKRFRWSCRITVKYPLHCPELGNVLNGFSGGLITRIEKALQSKL